MPSQPAAQDRPSIRDQAQNRDAQQSPVFIPNHVLGPAHDYSNPLERLFLLCYKQTNRRRLGRMGFQLPRTKDQHFSLRIPDMLLLVDPNVDHDWRGQLACQQRRVACNDLQFFDRDRARSHSSRQHRLGYIEHEH